MDKPRILIVDDEPDFVRFLNDALVRENFMVTEVNNGVQALKLAEEAPPDAILLDWNLPGMDGLEICRRLKQNPRTQHIPVIMLTVRGRETDVVLGLEMGAQDYITKRALRPRELVARIRNVCRLKSPEPPGGLLRADGLEVDTIKRRVLVNGVAVDLRPKEFDLLTLFLRRRGHVLTRNLICETIWQDPYFGSSRAIDITMSRLKSKIGPAADKLQTLKGIGYRFEE